MTLLELELELLLVWTELVVTMLLEVVGGGVYRGHSGLAELHWVRVTVAVRYWVLVLYEVMGEAS